MEQKDNITIESRTETKFNILDGLRILLGRKVIKNLIVEVSKEGEVLSEKAEIKIGSRKKTKPTKIKATKRKPVHLIEIGAGNFTLCSKEFTMSKDGNWSEKFSVQISEVTCLECCRQYDFNKNKQS